MRCDAKARKHNGRVINREVTANDERKLPIVSQIRFAMKENRRVESHGFSNALSESEPFPDAGHFHLNTPRHSGKRTLYRSVDMNRGVV